MLDGKVRSEPERSVCVSLFGWNTENTSCESQSKLQTTGCQFCSGRTNDALIFELPKV